MVLLTDRTIRELCSSTTPTSQFSSLHFIASQAIGVKRIERRAQTLTQSSFGRKGANVGRSTRFGADCRSAAWFHAARVDCGDYLTAGTTARSPHRRVATDHAPLPLPHCYVMGARPRKAFSKTNLVGV
ncbi:jg18644 [Pararge aegeria aegeria]|uniref:Jg18644 protein n=1 Tax=Pararge aegeria aegeria TaxID=348720 RepID=A0A8S4R9J0_9NEOP|nr:jg18644 [Pararge aegeria aegeria]